MSGIVCERCAAPMALADTACHACGAPAPQAGAALAWRKKGIALEKQGELARAGQAFQSALALDDADEIAHQLFIANLGKQGLLPQATAFYQQRLQANPEDAMALKQLGVVKLSADFLSQPPPQAKSAGPANALERWLAPSSWKVGMALLSLAASVAMAVASAFHVSGSVPGADAGLAGLTPDMEGMIFNVNGWSLNCGLNLVWLYLMYRNKKP